MYKIIFTLILIVSANVVVFADDSQQVITLKDGSQIKGELAGVTDGVYTVKTPIIGDVHVAASDVASITNGNVVAALPTNNASYPSSAPTASAPNMDQQIATAQQQMMANPQSMAILQQMAQNPEMVQALQDPALVQAVTNHDYQAVQNNPAIQKIISDPQIRAMIQKLAAQQQQQNSSSQ